MPQFFQREMLQKMSVPAFFIGNDIFSLGYSPQISLVFMRTVFSSIGHCGMWYGYARSSAIG